MPAFGPFAADGGPISGIDPKLPPTIVGYTAAKTGGIECLTHNTGAAQLVLIRDIGQREI
jgi:hypothetical protein